MSAVNTAAASLKTNLFFIHTLQQKMKLSISEGNLMSKRSHKKEF